MKALPVRNPAKAPHVLLLAITVSACAGANAACDLREENARVAENPQSPSAYVWRAACLLEIPPGKVAPPADRYKAGVKDLETALALDPNHFAAREKYAWAAYIDGKYAVARAEYTKALALNQLSATTHLGRGWASLKLCQFQEASADFKWAVSLDRSLQSKVATSEQMQQEWAACAPKPPR